MSSNLDVSLSSASHDIHKKVQTRFSYYVIGSKGTFGKRIGDRIQIVRLLYDMKNDRAVVECRIVVEDGTLMSDTRQLDMVDEKNTLHSGCAAYLLDMITALPFVLLGSVNENESVIKKTKFAMASFAPSQCLNVIHSGIAPLQLKIITETVTNIQNTLHVRGEIWDIDRNVLVSYANQIKVMPRKPPSAAIKLGLKL
ncbi:hypothetical protein Clacol_008591 [Clathrus columnatus]|uniref:Uncharacterized protein n=1 Tax=Clathrus columnatus TaxID=1419009 RepID=A0AAV5AI60_9AGAM|nr:hypothetical protein Clacol_008591 [Clathrus columnatus]